MKNRKPERRKRKKVEIIPYFFKKNGTMSSSTRHRDFCADGLFSHTRAEAVLQQLYNTVAEQESEIKRLRKDVAHLMNLVKGYHKDEDEARSKSATQQLSLKERVERLEACTTVPDSEVRTSSIGEQVSLQQKTLTKVMQAVSNKSTSRELQEFQSAQRQYLSEAIKNQGDETKESMLSLSDCIVSINERLDVISSELQTKVDKTTFKSLQADAHLIRDRAKFFKRMEDDMKFTKTSLTQIENNLNDHGSTINSLSATAKSHTEEIKRKVDTNEFYNVREQVGEVQMVVQTLAAESKDTLGNLKSVSSNMCELVTDLHELRLWTESKWQQCKESQLAMYTKEEVDDILEGAFVRKANFDIAFQKVNDNLNEKALDCSVSDQRRLIENLYIDLANIKRAVSVATKFVDWYGRRGEEFEQKEKAMDKELRSFLHR